MPRGRPKRVVDSIETNAQEENIFMDDMGTVEELEDSVVSIDDTDIFPQTIETDKGMSMDELNLAEMVETVQDNEEFKASPTRIDPEWTEYVLSHLAEKEMDEHGNPKVAGLVRLAEKFNGPVVDMDPVIVQSPSESNGYRCVCKYSLTYDTPAGTKRFGGTADAFKSNIRGKEDSPFKNFQTTIAETRAMGRAASRALALCGVVSSEELIEPVTTDFITSTQINSIDVHCKRMDLNVAGIVRWLKVESIQKLSRARAITLITKLSDYERGECEEKDPEGGRAVKNKLDSLKGYKSDWRS